MTRGSSPPSSSSFARSSVSFSALDLRPHHPQRFVLFVSIQPLCQSGQPTWISQVWVLVQILVWKTNAFGQLDWGWSGWLMFRRQAKEEGRVLSLKFVH